jgi:hypothetical protein
MLFCLLVGCTVLDEAPSDEERQQSLEGCIDLLRHARIEDRTWSRPEVSGLSNPFDKSGQRAPHMSLRLFACLRGQSAVISSDHSNSLASMP